VAKTRTETIHLGLGVDMRDFDAFARALRTAAPSTRRQLITRLRGVGALVAEEARAQIEPYSTSIPPSIKVRVSRLTVSVVAGGPDVPLAGLFELGNVGDKGRRDVFRHPVFGNREIWVSQPRHPFLAPALRQRWSEVERAAVEALDATIAEIL
jgi:hypothetical protein